MRNASNTHRLLQQAPLSQPKVQGLLAVVLCCSLAALSISIHSDDSPQRATGLQNNEAIASVEPSSLQIDLNTAPAHELALLPGVGPVLADRIVGNRQRLGDFSSVDQLARVHGIGSKTIQRIEKYCYVDSHRPARRSSDQQAD